jgi:hypothetical protein
VNGERALPPPLGGRNIALALLLAVFACVPAVVNAASASPRRTAVAWVGDMRSGNAAAACRLQDVQEVEGKPCGSLPPIVHHCPKQTGPPPKVEARSVAEQVGAVHVDGDRASAVVKAAPLSSRFSVVLGLRHTDRWRIASVRGGSRVVSPAGEIVTTPILTKLWPACVRRSPTAGQSTNWPTHIAKSDLRPRLPNQGADSSHENHHNSERITPTDTPRLLAEETQSPHLRIERLRQ